MKSTCCGEYTSKIYLCTICRNEKLHQWHQNNYYSGIQDTQSINLVYLGILPQYSGVNFNLILIYITCRKSQLVPTIASANWLSGHEV